MRVLAAALLLSACASNGSGPYLMISDSSEGAVVWNRFETPEACERARRDSDIEMRCVTIRELRGRQVIE